MLQRITKISNIGSFSGCAPAAVHFGEWTVVYGRNTYGKSTLSDVLSSLSRNEPEPIRQRATIPSDGSSQSVVLSFAAAGESEKSGQATFQGGKWASGLRPSHRLMVYDETFYYTHLFSSRTFSRDTKAKFSAFVLGEAGVAKAQKIAELRKRRNLLVRDLGKLKKAAFEGIKDHEDFVRMVVQDKEAALKEAQEKLREDYRAVAQQRKNSAAIVTRPEPVELSLNTGVMETMEGFNGALSSTTEAVHESAKAAVRQHVAARMPVGENPESWLRQGLSYGNGRECQFCGQSLTGYADELIESYRKYFDDTFEQHRRTVLQTLDAGVRSLQNDICAPLLLAVEKNENILKSYPELSDTAEIMNCGKAHDRLKAEIMRVGQVWKDLHENLIQECLAKAEKKKASPQNPVDVVQLSRARELVEKLYSLVRKYNEEVCVCATSSIHTFKSQLKQDELAKRLDRIQKEGEWVSRKLLRLEKEESCQEYREGTEEVENLSKEIPHLEEVLQQEQSAYIDRFFDSINRNFVAFGSHSFTLEKSLDKSGHVPLYFLRVKYKGQEIKEARLEKVFSESDRRALSLAVFWGGLEALGEEELSKTVVVLDDPVTSFDDHRVSETHKKIVELLSRVEQIIMFSHFREGVSHLLTTYRHSKPIKLIEIVRTGKGSDLCSADAELFCKSVHDKKREEIFAFIERKAQVLDVALRVFLEEEISMRFAKQIRDHVITTGTLYERIEGLARGGAICEKTAQSLHAWREALNPEHHTWTGADVEDRRNTAMQFMDFLYHELGPQPALESGPRAV